MDAKVDDWVVTPRRGKAVEINALWYNALRLLETWLAEEGDDAHARTDRRHGGARLRVLQPALLVRRRAAICTTSWTPSPAANDDACRPNQVFAISLDFPVLDAARWKSVMDVVTERLLTPVGLRSLAPGHPDYKSKYYGDLRSRDAAYHQGTVWAWLIGPYIDAWLKLNPDRVRRGARVAGWLHPASGRACIGSISEVFDAEPPYTPRGCIAQAWSVAEVLRCWVKTLEC